MSDIDESGVLHLNASKPKALLRELGGLKAKEYELLLAAGITTDGDPLRFSYGLGWLMLRRREPGLSWDDAQERIMADFQEEALADDDDESDEVDPPSAAS